MYLQRTFDRSMLSLLCLAAILVSVGCKRSQIQPSAFPAPPNPESVELQPGDEIEVLFRYTPELNSRQVVRSDGKVSLELLDDVVAEGMTPVQLDHKLTNMYESELVDPVLTVVVRNSSNQVVYVGGAVNNPGAIPLNRELTAMEAVMEAGGFDVRESQPKRVVILRHVGGKQQVARVIDLKQPLTEPRSQAFYLAPQDVVYVERSKVAVFGQFVEQYVRPVSDIMSIFVDYLLVLELNDDNDNN